MTRIVGESFMIGDGITATFLGLKNNLRGEKTTNVKLGITIPNNIDVHCEEIWQLISKLKQEKI